MLLGSWLYAVVGPACTLELDNGFSCGDGYWNREAGEDCDPQVPDSFVNACVGTSRPDGIADCDPEACTIINDIEQCGVCGDGRADELLYEECDKDDLSGHACPSGKGQLQCNADCTLDDSACDKCGNGMIDPGEECDPNPGLGGFVNKPPCTELVSPYGDALPYSAGLPGSCRDDCRWERTTCSYCGNLQIESDGYVIDFDGTKAIPEWCDGSDFDRSALEMELANSACTSVDAELRPIVACAPNCLDFIPLELRQPCCYKSGADCPPDDSPTRCCYEEEHAGVQLDPCQVILVNQDNFLEVCR